MHCQADVFLCNVLRIHMPTDTSRSTLRLGTMHCAVRCHCLSVAVPQCNSHSCRVCVCSIDVASTLFSCCRCGECMMPGFAAQGLPQAVCTCVPAHMRQQQHRRCHVLHHPTDVAHSCLVAGGEGMFGLLTARVCSCCCCSADSSSCVHKAFQSLPQGYVLKRR
jgi:hypothetical protein